VTWKPDYTNLTSAKAFLRIADTDDDVQIALYITSSSRAIDKFCGRQFGVVSTTEMREYEGKYDPTLGKTVYEIDDLMDVDDLAVVDQNAAEVTDYELWPLNAAQKGRPYTQLRVPGNLGRMTLDGLWGWSAVPSEVANATLMQVSRLAARRDSPYGVAGSPSEGSEVRLLSRLDPDVMVVLDDLKRKWWAA
jgi:hypothetical protein